MSCEAEEHCPARRFPVSAGAIAGVSIDVVRRQADMSPSRPAGGTVVSIPFRAAFRARFSESKGNRSDDGWMESVIGVYLSAGSRS